MHRAELYDLVQRVIAIPLLLILEGRMANREPGGFCERGSGNQAKNPHLRKGQTAVTRKERSPSSVCQFCNGQCTVFRLY